MISPDVVILSTADFASSVWTNKQHLARELSRYASVTYIESFGLRRPTLGASDIRRMLGRLRPSPSITSSGGDFNLRIVSPMIIPFHNLALVRALNRFLVKRLPIDGRNAVLWSFSPVTYGLEDRFAHTVYHSVDLVHAQPGVPRDVWLRAEASLLNKADRVIASSSGVCSHLRKMGRDDVLTWENVADTALYESAREIRQKRAVFAGNLTNTKVDFDLLRSLAASGVQVVIAGPKSIDGTSADREIKRLLAGSGIQYLGNLKPRELARVLASSMVGIIPYHLNEYTTGVFPMKVYEYLAAGLRVVSTELPSLTRIASDDVVLAEARPFIHAVQDGIASFNEQAVARRRSTARQHSWQARGGQALMLINSLISDDAAD